MVRIVRPGSWTETSGEVVTNPVFEGKTYPTHIEKFNKAWWKSLTIGGLIHFSADAPITQDAVGRYFTVNDPREKVYGSVYRWYLIDSVTINADGTYVYTPTADYNGPDSFTYTVTDGTVTIEKTVTLNRGHLEDIVSGTCQAAALPT